MIFVPTRGARNAAKSPGEPDPQACRRACVPRESWHADCCWLDRPRTERERAALGYAGHAELSRGGRRADRSSRHRSRSPFVRSGRAGGGRPATRDGRTHRSGRGAQTRPFWRDGRVRCHPPVSVFEVVRSVRGAAGRTRAAGRRGSRPGRPSGLVRARLSALARTRLPRSLAGPRVRAARSQG